MGLTGIVITTPDGGYEMKADLLRAIGDPQIAKMQVVAEFFGDKKNNMVLEDSGLLYTKWFWSRC